MASRLKTFSFVAGAVAAVLVPLHGDPAAMSLTHSEWARMLVRALDLEPALPLNPTASRVFSLLTWNESLAFDGDQYIHGDGVEPGAGLATAGPGGGEALFALAVARPGNYRLRARLQGDPARPAAAEVTERGKTKAAVHLTLVPPAQEAWVDGGSMELQPGVYNAALLLGAGTQLHRVEIDPPCLSPVQPPDGWRALAPVDRDDLAVTTLQAADLEWKLPAAAPPIEVDGRDFRVEAGPRLAAEDELAEGPRAGAEGTRALVFVDLADDGLYTIWAEGLLGGGQRWTADECRQVVLCPSRESSPQVLWRPVMTGHFTAGRHFFGVELNEGGWVRRLRAERKRATPADYVSTLREQGFDSGPAGTVNRGTAVDAMHFVEQKRRQMEESACGALRFLRPEGTLLADGSLASGPGTTPGGGGNGGGGFPGDPGGGGGVPPIPPPVDEPPASRVLP